MTDILRTIERLKTQTGARLAGLLDIQGRSEKVLATRWHAALSADPELYADGWYTPPPHGIITVFGKAEDGYARLGAPSFRSEATWPRDDILFLEEDVAAIYASPIHRATKLIGDFQCSLYHGSSAVIWEHIENVLRATLYIAGQARAGMALGDLYALAMDHAAVNGFENNIESVSDGTGTNIGHTIPLSYADDPTHALIDGAETEMDIQAALRTGRKFVNALEEQKIEDNMAFTVEPRFSMPGLPNIWFHLTVVMETGQPRICHGFRPVFEGFGMQRLLDILP